MDENTWRFAQFMMWLIGIQTGILMACLGFIWNNLSKRIDRCSDRVDNVDKRLVAVETLLHMKECCRLSPDEIKKAG